MYFIRSQHCVLLTILFHLLSEYPDDLIDNDHFQKRYSTDRDDDTNSDSYDDGGDSESSNDGTGFSDATIIGSDGGNNNKNKDKDADGK